MQHNGAKELQEPVYLLLHKVDVLCLSRRHAAGEMATNGDGWRAPIPRSPAQQALRHLHDSMLTRAVFYTTPLDLRSPTAAEEDFERAGCGFNRMRLVAL